MLHFLQNHRKPTVFLWIATVFLRTGSCKSNDATVENPMEFAFLHFSYEKSFKSKEALVKSVSSGFLVKFSKQLLSGRFLVRFS